MRVDSVCCDLQIGNSIVIKWGFWYEMRCNEMEWDEYDFLRGATCLYTLRNRVHQSSLHKPEELQKLGYEFGLLALSFVRDHFRGMCIMNCTPRSLPWNKWTSDSGRPIGFIDLKGRNAGDISIHNNCERHAPDLGPWNCSAGLAYTIVFNPAGNY